MPLTVDDLVEHLNMPASQQPAPGSARYRELERALRTATEELTRMTGLLDATSATVRVRVTGWTTRLPYVRLTSVSGATAVDLEAGLIDTAGVYGGATAVATYVAVTCTRDDPWPAALESAALDWASHVYETQRTTLNPAADDDVALPSFALPNRVAQFARPYLLPGFA